MKGNRNLRGPIDPGSERWSDTASPRGRCLEPSSLFCPFVLSPKRPMLSNRISRELSLNLEARSGIRIFGKRGTASEIPPVDRTTHPRRPGRLPEPRHTVRIQSIYGSDAFAPLPSSEPTLAKTSPWVRLLTDENLRPVGADLVERKLPGLSEPWEA